MKINLNFDLSKFEKIEEILFFDEPILTHLRLNEKDFFLYLVDNTDNSDIMLFFQVDEDIILEYLTKNKSLKEIILDSTFINILEQDHNGNIIESNIAMPVSLPQEYLPAANSYLEYNPKESSYYKEKIVEYNQKLYLLDLRKDSFYLKFSTNNKKFGDTIGFRELTNVMLKNVSLSYKNFVEIDFEKRFAKIIPIDSERNSIFKKVSLDTDLRMVDLKYGSFEIGLATDKLMKTNIEFKEVKEWADNVGNSYKDIVLDNNIDNEELESILENYSEDERNKIFLPIVKIVDNPDYNMKIRNNKEKTFHNLGIKSKEISNKIVTKSKIVEEQETEINLEIINVTTIIDKNSRKKNINLDNTLFSTVQEIAHILTYDDFIKFGFKNIELEEKINLHIENLNNNITLKAYYDGNDFEVIVINDKIEEGIRKMIEKISEYILNK